MTKFLSDLDPLYDLTALTQKMMKHIDRGVRRGSPRFVGKIGGIDVYVHDTVPKNTVYLIAPTQMRYEPITLKWKHDSRPPWSWSLPGERR